MTREEFDRDYEMVSDNGMPCEGCVLHTGGELYRESCFSAPECIGLIAVKRQLKDK